MPRRVKTNDPAPPHTTFHEGATLTTKTLRLMQRLLETPGYDMPSQGYEYFPRMLMAFAADTSKSDRDRIRAADIWNKLHRGNFDQLNGKIETLRESDEGDPAISDQVGLAVVSRDQHAQIASALKILLGAHGQSE
jgi:hypothetical protein